MSVKKYIQQINKKAVVIGTTIFKIIENCMPTKYIMTDRRKWKKNTKGLYVLSHVYALKYSTFFIACPNWKSAGTFNSYFYC